MNPSTLKFAWLLEYRVQFSCLVFCVGLGLGLYVAHGAKVEAENAAHQRFIVQCDGVISAVNARLEAHKQVLLGGAALFDASRSVARDEWRAYVDRLRLSEHFRGIQGMGFAPWIPATELPKHTEDIRREGFPNYSVRPAGQREAYTAIIYLEPFNGRNLRAFGYDMYSDPVRRAAMDLARDQNMAVLSGKVILVQETNQDVQAGTLMYVPVFQKNYPLNTVAQRRAALFGWVYSPFRMKDLLQASFADPEQTWAQQLHLKVYDGDRTIPQNLLYNSDPQDHLTAPALFQYQEKRAVAGRVWTFDLDSSRHADAMLDYRRAWLTLLGGMITSLLFALLLYSLLSTRRRAQEIAEQLTAELRQLNDIDHALSEQLSLQGAALNASVNAVVIFDRAGRVEWVNPAFTHLTGYVAEEAIGQHHSTLLGVGVPVDEPLWQALETGVAWEGELTSHRKNGSIYHEEVTFTPIHDDNGVISHVVAIKQDVTQRFEAELALQRQLRFAQAAHTVLESTQPDWILQEAVGIIGSTLVTDRALIYNADFVQDKAIGVCEWLNPSHPDISSSKATYPLAFFINGVTEVWKSRHFLVSNTKHIHPLLQQDGSWAVLHNRLKIKSLLWYPFAFHENGYYMLVLNDLHEDREWLSVETDFLDSISHQASIALEKIRFLRERERAENDLRIAATAFESQECMLILDGKHHILRSNKAFSNVTGYDSHEVLGQNIAMLRSAKHGVEFHQSIWEVVAQQGGWEGEVWSRRKNGEEYPTNLTITAVNDGVGRVSHYVATFTDITASKAAEVEIEHLAFYDSLTRLPNRRLLRDRLRQVIALCGRTEHQAALLFIDLDNFKTLNDTLGHDMGDLLLQQVGQRLLMCVRESDTVARLGGDEFVALLTNLSAQGSDDAEQAKIIAQKILSALNVVYQLGNHDYSITPSIGVALFSGQNVTIEMLMRQADIAMYQAKKSGRNTVCLFDPAMQTAINNRAALEKALQQAIEMQELALYYQPQVDEQHRPVGVEALLRWARPLHGLVSPDVFIPLAEETGLIVPIGLWVLETAAAQLQRWAQHPRLAKLSIAVNVSSKQFRQPDFAQRVERIVRKYSIAPNLLKLEVTESLLLDNIASTIITMNQLKNLGVLFSLDDFGTGYSSLQYLKQLPIDQLKIDQSFVRDIAVDSSDKAIVSTIIAMAYSLNLEVIAEGVETTEQESLLFEQGCLCYQGYLFGKPMPAADLEAIFLADKFVQST